MVEHIPHTPVQLGDTGAEVVELQRTLAETGDYQGEIDGQYGPATAEAVERAQELRGLSPTGQCDADTWAALDPLSVMPVPVKDACFSDGPHFSGDTITFGAMVRAGEFAPGELVVNAWIQTFDDDPRAVWEQQVSNEDTLGPGGGITTSWAVDGMTAGVEYGANVTVNIDVIQDSVEEENNWMVSFVWDGQGPTEVKRIR